MNKIDSILNNYIENKNSKNALMITGEWGCGKTYYYKNNLQKIIREKGFVPIYISLNGLKNEDQLRKIILAKIITGNSEKSDESKFKIAVSTLKNKIANVIGKINSIDSYLPLLNIGDFNLEKVIFCFDDMERTSREFFIDDLLGFINSEFVEHNNHKVIIIGDESKNQLDTQTYRSAKEKLIGWTVEYLPNHLEIGKSLLRKYYTNDLLKGHLERNEKFIVQLIEEYQSKNLRTILFFLDCLKTIFSVLEENHKIAEKIIINFAFIVSIEYKKGNLFVLKNELELPNFITNPFTESEFGLNDIGKERGREIEDYARYFNKYKFDTFFSEPDRVKYEFCKPIYDFITTGYLDNIELKKFLDLHSRWLRIEQKSPETLLIEKLTFFNLYSNKEFQSNYIEVKSLIKENKLNIGEFLFASACILQLSEIEVTNENPKELEKFLLEHIDFTSPVNIMNNDHWCTLLPFADLNEGLQEKYAEFYNKAQNTVKSIFSQRSNKTRDSLLNNWIENSKERSTFYRIINDILPDKICAFIIKHIDNREFMKNLYDHFYVSYNYPDLSKTYHHHIEKLLSIKEILLKSAYEKHLEFVDRHWIDSLNKAIIKGINFLENPIFISSKN